MTAFLINRIRFYFFSYYLNFCLSESSPSLVLVICSTRFVADLTPSKQAFEKLPKDLDTTSKYSKTKQISKRYLKCRTSIIQKNDKNGPLKST